MSRKHHQSSSQRQRGSYLFEIRLQGDRTDSREGYNSIYAETTLSQIESFYIWLFKQMKLPPNGRLLDLACGAGEVVRLAGQYGLNATGVDISHEAAHKALKQVQPSGTITVGSGEQIPFASQSFDFVTNIGSLEHFIDPAQGVREMARVLKPHGRAHILVPNTFSLLNNVWSAFREGYTAIDEQPIQRYGARDDWTCLFEENGLIVKKTIKYERPWPYFFPDWRYYLRHPKDMVRMFVTPFVPVNLAHSFFFVCEPANLANQQ